MTEGTHAMTASSKVGESISSEYEAYRAHPSRKKFSDKKNQHEVTQLQIQFNLKIAHEMENVGCNRNTKIWNLNYSNLLHQL